MNKRKREKGRQADSVTSNESFVLQASLIKVEKESVSLRKRNLT